MTIIEVVEHPATTDGVVYYGVRQTDPNGSASTWNTGRDRAAAEALFASIMAAPKCVECGDPQCGRWDKSTTEQMAARQMCFTCNHWTNMLTSDAAHPSDIVIVGGCHFTISPDKPAHFRGFVGHGGRRFDIRFHDGREVVTHNLWAQGSIPNHFRQRFPDNAVFVAREAVGYVGQLPSGGYVGAGSAHFVEP